MSKKFMWNPLTNSLEDTSNPSPHISSADAKKNDPTAGAKYIPKDQQLFETLKVPGYETPEKSDASYKKLNEQEKTKQYADKIIDTNYEKNKHKTPFTHAAENAAKELKFKWNSTTGTFRNNDDQTLPMKESVEINEALDKNFKDQKTDNYLAKLNNKNRAREYKTINQLEALKKFGQNTLIKNEQRKKDYLLKQWGIQNGPHNPTPKEKIKTFHLSEPKLKDKKYKENFEKEYGTQAIKNRVRAKELKNKREGKKPYEGFATHDIVVAETTKDEAREQLKAIKTEPIKLEPTYLDYRLAAQKEPTITMSVDEYVARRVPTEIDPPGITALEEARKFKDTINLANQKFPTAARGLGPLLGEEK